MKNPTLRLQTKIKTRAHQLQTPEERYAKCAPLPAIDNSVIAQPAAQVMKKCSYTRQCVPYDRLAATRQRQATPVVLSRPFLPSQCSSLGQKVPSMPNPMRDVPRTTARCITPAPASAALPAVGLSNDPCVFDEVVSLYVCTR